MIFPGVGGFLFFFVFFFFSSFAKPVDSTSNWRECWSEVNKMRLNGNKCKNLLHGYKKENYYMPQVRVGE